MSDTYATAAIDIVSIKNNWPSGRQMPPVITDLAALMGPWPWGSIGYWHMTGRSFEDYWSYLQAPEATLDGKFGLFMHFAGGTVYAIWYHDDDLPGAHPVVCFPDDNRDIYVLSPNINAFFTEWASGRGVGRLEPFDYETTPEQLAERKAYGKQMLAVIDAIPEPPAGRPLGDLQARLTATCERTFAIVDEKERQKKLVEIYGDRIDLASAQKHWPRARLFPPLLGPLATMIRPMINGSVGRPDFSAQRMSDLMFQRATDLHDQFGFFFTDQNYRFVALWFHEGSVPGSEPIVSFDNYNTGETAKLEAPNFKAYFVQWAQAIGENATLHNYNMEPEIVAQRQELAGRLLAHIEAWPDPPKGPTPPDIGAFVRSHIAQAQAADAADPLIREMKQLLAPHFPVPGETRSTTFSMAFSEDPVRYDVIGKPFDMDAFTEAAALTPLLLKARAARAQGPTVTLGLAMQAHIDLDETGRLMLNLFWEE